ncbi:predicted protein [Plenodomus lingam JN3]|uniref:Predicted protein n=1 Tax=Leptosphaeria maculans (strain JN3 / isolate v23.1.3 / race Av1-4-5-6-7-8) TaxID=985895 RepID=E4ZNN5_LEPMJ|nr:predicted protein [Plenodomus lingam JN3]CBX93254.1 predicted protein [Plenodomus lingam JN3]
MASTPSTSNPPSTPPHAPAPNPRRLWLPRHRLPHPVARNPLAVAHTGHDVCDGAGRGQCESAGARDGAGGGVGGAYAAREWQV